jgi:hypothetical protein
MQSCSHSRYTAHHNQWFIDERNEGGYLHLR